MTREELFDLFTEVLPDGVDASMNLETGAVEFFGLEDGTASWAAPRDRRVTKADVDRIVERKQAELVAEAIASMRSS